MNLIEVHSLEEYNEAIEKCTPSGRYFNKNATALSWILRDPSEFKDQKIRKIFGTNVSICDEALELLGKSVIYSGHEIGILKGVEITEEDFYWVVDDVVREKEVSMSCVGGIDYLDIELLRQAEKYGRIEKTNSTPPNIAFMMGGIWREQNPTREMIGRILELAQENKDSDYIITNYKKR